MTTETGSTIKRSPSNVARGRALIVRSVFIAGILGISFVGNAMSQENADNLHKSRGKQHRQSLESQVLKESADIMHKPRGLRKQDLLLRAFGSTLTAVKRKDWRAVSQAVKKIDSNIKVYKNHFGIDLKPRLDKAVMAKKSGPLFKVLAQAIYFEMRVNFKAIQDTEMKDYLDSKARLDQAEGYYTKILSGNMKRKNPKGHQKIQEQFILAAAALGNPGLDITLPMSPSDLKGFEEAAKNIEMELAAVYTYFNGQEKS